MRTTIALCAVLCCVWIGASSAAADTFVTLPDGGQEFTTATGVHVDLSRKDESATVSPGISANGMTRVAWVSGVDYATVDGAKTATMESGYLVGCQVDLGDGLQAGADMWMSIGSSVSPEISGSLSVKPGQVAAVKLGTKELAPGSHALGYAYHNLGLQIDSCAGAAQARAYTHLRVANDAGSTVVTLYGKPFSLG